MSQTSIEWSQHVWNPIVGCSVVSPGCISCYAMRMAARLERMGQEHYAGLTRQTRAGAVWTGEVRLVEKALEVPLRRRTPTTYFVNSMSDLFHESVPDEWIDRVFAVMALAPQHTFQVLTKRSARMREYVSERGGIIQDWCYRPERYFSPAKDPTVGRIGKWPDRRPGWPLPNVWLGVSAEDQTRADERIADLIWTPAAVRFVSAEPLLGPIDFRNHDGKPTAHGWSSIWRGNAIGRPWLDWVIVGGESGPGARPMVLGWAKDIVRQCRDAGVAAFVKQLGARPTNREGIPHPIRDRKGGAMEEWPEDLRVREMPRTDRVPAWTSALSGGEAR
jgi:protein gp37